MASQHSGVVEAVERDLKALGLKASRSSLAAAALALARELDDFHADQECEECGHVQSWTSKANSATSKSMCAKVLVEVLRELRALAPPKKEKTKVDDLAAKRASRRRTVARSKGAAASPRS